MRSLLLGFCFLALGACATSPDESQGANNENVVTREEILATGATSLFQVVREIRPSWIPRGPNDQVLIMVDGERRPREILQGRIDVKRQDRTSLFFATGGVEGVQGIEWERARVSMISSDDRPAGGGSRLKTWAIVIHYQKPGNPPTDIR